MPYSPFGFGGGNPFGGLGGGMMNPFFGMGGGMGGMGGGAPWEMGPGYQNPWGDPSQQPAGGQFNPNALFNWGSMEPQQQQGPGAPIINYYGGNQGFGGGGMGGGWNGWMGMNPFSSGPMGNPFNFGGFNGFGMPPWMMGMMGGMGYPGGYPGGFAGGKPDPYAGGKNPADRGSPFANPYDSGLPSDPPNPFDPGGGTPMDKPWGGGGPPAGFDPKGGGAFPMPPQYGGPAGFNPAGGIDYSRFQGMSPTDIHSIFGTYGMPQNFDWNRFNQMSGGFWQGHNDDGARSPFGYTFADQARDRGAQGLPGWKP